MKNGYDMRKQIMARLARLDKLRTVGYYVDIEASPVYT